MHLPTAGLLIIRNRKLLLAFSKNKQCYYLPGGKVDPGETPAEALCREIAEELTIHLTETELTFYTHITAPAYGEENGIIMEQDCYFTSNEKEPVATSEISKLNYFTVQEYLQEKQTAPGAVLILEQLKKDGLID